MCILLVRPLPSISCSITTLYLTPHPFCFVKLLWQTKGRGHRFPVQNLKLDLKILRVRIHPYVAEIFIFPPLTFGIVSLMGHIKVRGTLGAQVRWCPVSCVTSNVLSIQIVQLIIKYFLVTDRLRMRPTAFVSVN